MNLYKNRQKYFGRLFPKDQHIYHEQADGADLFKSPIAIDWSRRDCWKEQQKLDITKWLICFDHAISYFHDHLYRFKG